MKKINPDHAVIAIVVFAMAITGCGLTLVATADTQAGSVCNDDDSRRPPRDGERPRPTASDILEKDDTNGNGVIDANEFPGPGDHFDDFDTDGNGSLSADEIEESLTRRPPPRRESDRGNQTRR